MCGGRSSILHYGSLINACPCVCQCGCIRAVQQKKACLCHLQCCWKEMIQLFKISCQVQFFQFKQISPNIKAYLCDSESCVDYRPAFTMVQYVEKSSSPAVISLRDTSTTSRRGLQHPPVMHGGFSMQYYTVKQQVLYMMD